MFVEIFLLMHVAIIPIIVQEFRLTLLEASLVATAPSLVALLMNLPCGILADRVSVNRLLSASMLVEGVAAFLASQASSFGFLVVAVSLLRVSSPIYHVSGLSQISKISKPEHMSRSIGFHNALGNVGSAAGVLSLTLFLSLFGWRSAYLFWSIPAIAWGVVILLSPHLKTHQTGTIKPSGTRGLDRLPVVFSSGFLFFLIFIGLREVGATGSNTFMTTFFVDARGFSETMASLTFGLGPFIGIVGSLCGGFWAERTGAKKALSWAVLLCTVGFVLLAAVSDFSSMILIYVFYSFFSSTVWAPINALVARLTPASDRGLSYSIYFFVEGLLASIAPTLAAGVIELTSVWFVIPFAAVFFGSAVLTLHRLPTESSASE